MVTEYACKIIHANVTGAGCGLRLNIVVSGIVIVRMTNSVLDLVYVDVHIRVNTAHAGMDNVNVGRVIKELHVPRLIKT